MAEIIELIDLANLQNQTTAVNAINANNETIEAAFTDVLSLSGVTPNQMLSTLDMNSNQIINLPSPLTANSPLRLQDASTLNGGGTVSGIPTGGTSGQLLTKNSSNNFDASWTTVSGSGTTFQQNGAGAVVRTVTSKLQETVSVFDFGATGNGTTDDTVAIQNAINSLPNSGGIVLFPLGNYKISSSLTIGNGTTTTVSTKEGVILRGVGIPNTPTGLPSLNGYTASAGPKLTWAGGATPMIAINGPLQGWGVQNLFLDGASVSQAGIFVTSGAFGDSSNLTIQNCLNGIYSTANPLGGYTGVGNVDSLRNNWTNIFVYIPAINNSNGITLHGDSGGTSDTDYNVFTNTFIRNGGTATGVIGLHLAVNDANMFINLSVSGFAGTGSTGVLFDYSFNPNFPGSIDFYHYEVGGTIPWGIAGTPGALATPCKFYGLIQANGAPAPTIANTQAIDGPWLNYTPSPSSGTATFTVNFARYKTLGKTTFVEFDATITGGAPTATVNFTLPNNPNSSGGVIGRELTNGLIVAGQIQNTTTIVGIVKPALSTFNVNERVVVSGVYENQ